ncbi:O-methyltransferase [Mycena albidolilacea]|uniref:O-methyltransferase n=1 Tax=Mycena albidolilacea TaxID=1033008 RepID=A0AAD6ZVY3_9AGAR|nr:O-methyltransferase [Mycena albidolilacea]
MDSPSSLRQFSNIIAQAVTYIEAEYAKASAPLPSLDESFNPTTPAEAVGMQPVAFAASSIIIAAAAQITYHHGQQPGARDYQQFYHLSSCLQAASALDVVEILREGGLERSRTDPDKLGTPPNYMRRSNPSQPECCLLATYRIFGEITPDVFTNNRISSVIDKWKQSHLLFESAAEKFTGTSGLGDFLEHLTDEGFKSSAYMTDALLDPATASSQEPTATPFSHDFSTDAPLFAWYEIPENKDRLARLASGRPGLRSSARRTRFYSDQLPKNAVVIDVSGGTGSTSLIIAKTTPSLNIVIQDRAPVIEQSKANWAEHFKSHVDSRVVELQVQDFFAPQPIKNADVVLPRQIVHDWPDGAVIKILAQLRAAATPTTKLIIVDQIIPTPPQATRSSTPSPAQCGLPRPPPCSATWAQRAPFLTLHGIAGLVIPICDAAMQMYAPLNGRERTMGGFVDVCGKAGRKIVQVYHLPGSLSSKIMAAPG